MLKSRRKQQAEAFYDWEDDWIPPEAKESYMSQEQLEALNVKLTNHFLKGSPTPSLVYKTEFRGKTGIFDGRNVVGNYRDGVISLLVVSPTFPVIPLHWFLHEWAHHLHAIFDSNDVNLNGGHSERYKWLFKQVFAEVKEKRMNRVRFSVLEWASRKLGVLTLPRNYGE